MYGINFAVPLLPTGHEPLDAPFLNVAPSITSGALGQVNQLHVCTSGNWLGASAFTYQWESNDVAIAGATANTYTPVAGDVGKYLTCIVTAWAGAGNTGSSNMAASQQVAIGTVPVKTVDPVLTGNTALGSVMSCTVGGWSQQPQLPHLWVWYADAVEVARQTPGGATSTYTTQPADAGKTLHAEVQTHNSLGNSLFAPSNGIVLDVAMNQSVKAPLGKAKPKKVK
jgi:hypothetical protein